jgi:hypothetical protein
VATSQTPTLSDTQIEAIIAQPKLVTENVSWDHQPTNSNFRWWRSPVFSEEGVALAGMSCEMGFRLGVAPEDCRYSFTLFLRRLANKARVYQIEVCRPDRVSHREGGNQLMGPHQHFGERAEAIEPPPNLFCVDHQQWLHLFLQNANIGFGGQYRSPTDGFLF